MKQDILLKDVLPCIQIWTFFIASVLLLLLYWLLRFKKEHPDIFQPDTTADNHQTLRQKAELRRQYNNKSILAVSISLAWICGIALACNYFVPTIQNFFIFGFIVLVILWIFSLLQHKS